MDFGGLLKEIRKRKGLTLKQLAKQTGLSAAYLSNLENNITSPTLVNLQKLCEAMQISMADIVVNQAKEQGRVMRGEDRPQIFVTGSGIVYNLIFDQSANAKITSMTIQADNYAEEMSWGHHDDELRAGPRHGRNSGRNYRGRE